MGPMNTIAVFSVDVATTPPPSILHPYRSACGIGYASYKLSKMVSNSASCPFNSCNWCIDSFILQ